MIFLLYCMDLAQRGFAVVNFSYRLAPENKFPAALEDTNTVFAWVLEHAEQYGFDSEHVFAVGDSAGAHMLGLYAAMCTNPAPRTFLRGRRLPLPQSWREKMFLSYIGSTLAKEKNCRMCFIVIFALRMQSFAAMRSVVSFVNFCKGE